MFVFVFLCRQRPLRRADHSSKGVLPTILIRLRNLRCETAKVLTRTVEPLMIMMMITRYLTPAHVNDAPLQMFQCPLCV
jgi:hypothetical protein